MSALQRYKDRRQAGVVLAQHLTHLKEEPELLVLGIPRGGVVVAAPVARELAAPLDILPARKIGAPGNPEFAIGAVSEEVEYIDHDLINRFGFSEAYIVEELGRQRELSRQQGSRLRRDRKSADVAGKSVIVVDDGVATGATMNAALQALRKHVPKRITLAVPVGPADSLNKLAEVADEVICPLRPAWFWSVGSFYDYFDQVSDEEVIALLDEFHTSPAEKSS